MNGSSTQAAGAGNHLGPEYLTPAQVARVLQVGPKTVYRWAAADPTMPMLKIGGTVRFPRERLLRWLQDREQGAPRIRRRMLSVGKSAETQEGASG